MNLHISLLALALFVFAGCVTEKKESKALDTFSSAPAALHHSKGKELKKRKAKEDAEAFFANGYKGYIMTSGGLIIPIGVQNLSETEHYNQSILDFEIHQNSELKNIQELLIDHQGNLNQWEYRKNGISPEREYYLQVRADYSAKFNQRMENLITE